MPDSTNVISLGKAPDAVPSIETSAEAALKANEALISKAEPPKVEVPQASGGTKTVIAPVSPETNPNVVRMTVTKSGDPFSGRVGTLVTTTPTGVELRFINAATRTKTEVFYLLSEVQAA